MANAPKNAAKPQDRKAKGADDGVMEVEALGRTWRIEYGALDDVEFTEWVGALQDNNVFVMSKIGKHLLGDEGYAEAKELMRDPDTGRVKATVMLEFLAEILNG